MAATYVSNAMAPAGLQRDLHIRTARLIERWFQEHGMLFLHEAAVMSVMRTAVLEKDSVMDDGSSPLQHARKYRDRLFWESVKPFGEQKRRIEGIVQTRPGKTTAWEDVIVQMVGLHWRDVLHSEGSSWTKNMRMRIAGPRDL